LDNGVPIVENKPLARSLYAETEIGDIAPVRFWEALAVVLASVSKINEERRAARDLGA
jgi:flagellar biosynthetic protein FlhB